MQHLDDKTDDYPVGLIGLGFTHAQAALYCALLRSAPATAYRLADDVGAWAPNTYQALKTLVKKGAATSIEGAKGRTKYMPVPPHLMLEGIKKTFDEHQLGVLSWWELASRAA